MRNDLNRQGSSNLFDDLGKAFSLTNLQKGKGNNTNKDEAELNDIKIGFKRKNKDVSKGNDKINDNKESEEGKVFNKKAKK